MDEIPLYYGAQNLDSEFGVSDYDLARSFLDTFSTENVLTFEPKDEIGFQWTTLYAAPEWRISIYTGDLKSTYVDNVNNSLTLYYNTKNDRLVFGLKSKISASQTVNPSNVFVHISVVKKTEKPSLVNDPSSMYTIIPRTRKSKSPLAYLPALTVANTDQAVIRLDHSWSLNTSVTIWDVSNNHEYYKGKRAEKKCSKSGCLCDGTSKDFFILVEVFHESSGQTYKLLSVISNGFQVRSKQLKKEKNNKEEETLSLKDESEIQRSKRQKTDTTTVAVTKPVTPLASAEAFNINWNSTPSVPLPHQVAYHTASYLPIFNKVFVVGGRSEVSGLFAYFKDNRECTSAEVWSYCLETTKWSHLNIKLGSKPSPRAKHQAICYNNWILIFGGEAQTEFTNDIWALDIEGGTECVGTWRQLIVDPEEPQPHARCCHSATLFEVSKSLLQMVVFGGVTTEKKDLADTWILDIHLDSNGRINYVEWRSMQVNGPRSRFFHTAVPLSGNRMAIFGGVYRHYDIGVRDMRWLNDMWVLHLDEKYWTQIANTNETKPKPRDGPAVVFNKNQMIIIGGWTGQKKIIDSLQAFENKGPVSVLQSGLFFLAQLEEAHFSDDMWLFDFDSNTWKQLTITPKITACGHAVAVLLPDSILVIGGETFPPKITNSVWKLVPSEIKSSET